MIAFLTCQSCKHWAIFLNVEKAGYFARIVCNLQNRKAIIRALLQLFTLKNAHPCSRCILKWYVGFNFCNKRYAYCIQILVMARIAGVLVVELFANCLDALAIYVEITDPQA